MARGSHSNARARLAAQAQAAKCEELDLQRWGAGPRPWGFCRFLVNMILYGFYMDFRWNLYGLHMILYDFIWFISPFSVSQNDLNGTFEGRGTPMVFDGILPCSKAIVFDSLRRFSHHGHGPGGALAGTGWPR